jgi:hypothetical protein
MQEVEYTPAMRFTSLFPVGEDPSTWSSAKHREACEYVSEMLLGSKDYERFEEVVETLVSR